MRHQLRQHQQEQQKQQHIMWITHTPCMAVSVCAHGEGGVGETTAWPEISVTTPTASGGGGATTTTAASWPASFRHKNTVEFGAFKCLARQPQPHACVFISDVIWIPAIRTDKFEQVCIQSHESSINMHWTSVWLPLKYHLFYLLRLRLSLIPVSHLSSSLSFELIMAKPSSIIYIIKFDSSDSGTPTSRFIWSEATFV